MHRSKHRINVQSQLLVAAIALGSVGSAAAANLFGGGSNLVAPAYVGDRYNAQVPKTRLSRDPSITFPLASNAAILGNQVGSNLPVFAKYRILYGGDAVSYCQTGSRVGKLIFNNSGLVASNSCGNAGSAPPTGFQAIGSAPDFIASDVPFTSADYGTFVTNMAATRNTIVQVPATASTIALPFKDGAGLSSLALTTQTLCQIYSAQVTDWTDPRLGLGLSSGPRPITLIYRIDGSGTSFVFTSYLAAHCNGLFGVPAGFFKPGDGFANAVMQGGSMPGYAATLGVNGDSALVTAVGSTAGALGYSGVAEALSQGVMYATLNGFDPASLGVLNITLPNLLSGMLAPGVPVPPTIPSSAANCVRLVNPTAPITPGYPIVAISYLNAYYAGNPASQIVPIKNLFKLFYDSTNRPALPPGQAYLDANAVFRASVIATINNCVN